MLKVNDKNILDWQHLHAKKPSDLAYESRGSTVCEGENQALKILLGKEILRRTSMKIDLKSIEEDSKSKTAKSGTSSNTPMENLKTQEIKASMLDSADYVNNNIQNSQNSMNKDSFSNSSINPVTSLLKFGPKITMMNKSADNISLGLYNLLLQLHAHEIWREQEWSVFSRQLALEQSKIHMSNQQKHLTKIYQKSFVRLNSSRFSVKNTVKQQDYSVIATESFPIDSNVAPWNEKVKVTKRKQCSVCKSYKQINRMMNCKVCGNCVHSFCFPLNTSKSRENWCCSNVCKRSSSVNKKKSSRVNKNTKPRPKKHVVKLNNDPEKLWEELEVFFDPKKLKGSLRKLCSENFAFFGSVEKSENSAKCGSLGKTERSNSISHSNSRTLDSEISCAMGNKNTSAPNFNSAVEFNVQKMAKSDLKNEPLKNETRVENNTTNKNTLENEETTENSQKSGKVENPKVIKEQMTHSLSKNEDFCFCNLGDRASCMTKDEQIPKSDLNSKVIRVTLKALLSRRNRSELFIPDSFSQKSCRKKIRSLTMKYYDSEGCDSLNNLPYLTLRSLEHGYAAKRGFSVAPKTGFIFPPQKYSTDEKEGGFFQIPKTKETYELKILSSQPPDSASEAFAFWLFRKRNTSSHALSNLNSAEIKREKTNDGPAKSPETIRKEIDSEQNAHSTLKEPVTPTTNLETTKPPDIVEKTLVQIRKSKRKRKPTSNRSKEKKNPKKRSDGIEKTSSGYDNSESAEVKAEKSEKRQNSKDKKDINNRKLLKNFKNLKKSKKGKNLEIFERTKSKHKLKNFTKNGKNANNNSKNEKNAKNAKTKPKLKKNKSDEKNSKTKDTTEKNLDHLDEKQILDSDLSENDKSNIPTPNAAADLSEKSPIKAEKPVKKMSRIREKIIKKIKKRQENELKRMRLEQEKGIDKSAEDENAQTEKSIARNDVQLVKRETGELDIVKREVIENGKIEVSYPNAMNETEKKVFVKNASEHFRTLDKAEFPLEESEISVELWLLHEELKIQRRRNESLKSSLLSRVDEKAEISMNYKEENLKVSEEYESYKKSF